MGMSASQCRLLFISSRISDIEMKSMNIANQKIRLASESEQIATDYAKALNKTKLTYDTINSNGDRVTSDLSYNSIMSPDGPLSNRYMIRDRNGKPVVSNDIAIAYDQAHGNLNTFLARIAISNPNIYSDQTEVLNESILMFGSQPNKMRLPGGSTGTVTGTDIDVDGNEDGDDDGGNGNSGSTFVESGNYAQTQSVKGKEPDFQKTGLQLTGDLGTGVPEMKGNSPELPKKDGSIEIPTKIGTQDIPEMKGGYSPELPKKDGETLQIKGGTSDVPEMKGDSPELPKKGGETLQIKGGTSDVPEMKGGYSPELPKKGGETLQIKGGTSDVPEMKGGYSPELPTKGGETLQIKGGTTEQLFNGGVLDLKLQDNSPEGSVNPVRYNTQQTNKGNSCPTDFEYVPGYTPSLYQAINLDNVEFQYTDDIVIIDDGTNKTDPDSKTSTSDPNLEDPNLEDPNLEDPSDPPGGNGGGTITLPNGGGNSTNPTRDFYTRLFYAIQAAGGYSDVNGNTAGSGYTTTALGNKDMLNFMIENGEWIISEIGSDGSLTERSIAEITSINEVPDKDGIAKAEAEYNAKTKKINTKEKLLDNKLKQLDTEHSALSTERDSVKEIINKNIESSFEMFS